MSLLGTYLTLLIGPVVPLPAPPFVMQSLNSLTITNSDDARSGFQLTFNAGRSSVLDTDYPLLVSELMKPFNRVIVVVTVGLVPQVLIDGIITTQELSPSSRPEGSFLTITGEDISVMMDLEEKSIAHPSMDAEMIVGTIMLEYEEYGIIPEILPAELDEIPLLVDRVPIQQDTDLRYIQALAAQYGYVFYVAPGPVPGTNTAYWGPPVRIGVPQSALSVDMGPGTNVEKISFTYSALAPTLVVGEVLDFDVDAPLPVATVESTRIPLAAEPALLVNLPYTRISQLRHGGQDAVTAEALAQGRTDLSTDRTVVAQGELDTLRYGELLKARTIVGLRGAGYSYDGLYYVQSVTHQITQKKYTQSFVLTREGLGSTTPEVIP